MKSSLKQSIILQMCYEVLTFILPLITSPYIARVLGAEQLGIYAFSYSVAYYFQMFAMLGIKYYGTRAIASVRDNRELLNHTFSSIFYLHASLSLISVALYVGYCMLFVEQNNAISLLQTLNVIATFFDINWLFFGMEDFKITVTRNALIKVATVFLVFLFVKSRGDLWKYTLIMSLGLAISQSVVWFFAKRKIRFVKVTIYDIFPHLKPLFVLFIPILSVSVLKYMDKIMLGIMNSDQQVGFYDNVHKIIEIPSSLIIAVGTVMLPRISNLVTKGKEDKSKQYTILSYKYLMILSFGMSFGLVAVADVFAVVFWGEEFLPCGPIIKILALSIPFTAYANITRTQYLMPNYLDNIYMKSTVVGMFVNLILNYILVKKYAANGVAIATLISEFIIMVYQMLSIRKEFRQLEVIKSFICYLIPGLAMIFCIPLVFNGTPSLTLLIWQIVGGCLIFGMLSLCILWITKDDILFNRVEYFIGRLRK